MADLTKRQCLSPSESVGGSLGKETAWVAPEWDATMRAAADEIERLQKECLHSSRDAVKRAGIMAAAEWAMYGIDVDGDHRLIQVAKTLFADLVELTARAERLAEALQWYVDNDDTNDGQEGNEYWLAGRDRAIALLRDQGESQ